MTGWLLHDIASYAARDQPEVQAVYGLDSGFGVRLIVPGSAADRAGIKEGDVILSAGTVISSNFEPALLSAGPTAQRVSLFNRAVAAMAPPLSVTLTRNGVRHSVSLSPDHGCGGFFVVANERGVNAWSDGEGVAVTAQLVDLASDDSMLAFILAHEMAHNLLHHGRLISPTGRLLAGIGIGAGKVRANEQAADALAVTLIGDAGYDPHGAVTVLQKLEAKGAVGNSLTHHSISQRIALIEQAISAWQAKQSTLAK